MKMSLRDRVMSVLFRALSAFGYIGIGCYIAIMIEYGITVQAVAGIVLGLLVGVLYNKAYQRHIKDLSNDAYDMEE